MSALPAFVRLRLAQLWQVRHRPRSRDIGPYFPLSNGQAKLDRAQITGATVDQCRLRAAEGVSAEDVWAQSDAGNPFRNEPRILACCLGLARQPSAGEQKSAGHLAGRLEVVINGLAGLLGQLEPN